MPSIALSLFSAVLLAGATVKAQVKTRENCKGSYSEGSVCVGFIASGVALFIEFVVIRTFDGGNLIGSQARRMSWTIFMLILASKRVPPSSLSPERMDLPTPVSRTSKLSAQICQTTAVNLGELHFSITSFRFFLTYDLHALKILWHKLRT
jgi:hypothetical protein